MLKALKKIIVVQGREVNTEGMTQAQLRELKKHVPKLVVNEVSKSKPSESDYEPDVSGGA